MARYILNEQFVRGINLVEMMYFPSTTAGPKPPPSYMGEAGFPELATYVRRMSYLMAMGRPDARVGLLLPSSSMWLGDQDADRQFVSAERLLSEHQIDFDIVSEDALGHHLQAGHGTFATASGNQYSTIVLPDAEILSEEAFTRLRAFAAGGGQVIVLGSPPRWISGRTLRNARAATASDFRWSTILDVQLPPTPVPPQFPPTAAPEPQSIPADLVRSVIAAAPPAVRTEVPEAGLRVMKRRWKDADVFLLFNEGSSALHTAATLNSRGRRVERWDAEKGVITPVPATHTGSGPRLTLDLAPDEAEVLVMRGPQARATLRP